MIPSRADCAVEMLGVAEFTPTYRLIRDQHRIQSTLENPHKSVSRSGGLNVGIGAFKDSTLLKRLGAGNYAEVPNQLRRWVRSGAKKVQGLVNRREHEIELGNGELA
jgi:GH24 family phage-related lysozyme (muramidase)